MRLETFGRKGIGKGPEKKEDSCSREGMSGGIECVRKEADERQEQRETFPEGGGGSEMGHPIASGGGEISGKEV